MRDKIKHLVHFQKRYRDEKRACCNSKIRFYNWWTLPLDYENFWFYQFLQFHGVLNDYPKKTIAFFSGFGDRLALKINTDNIKIFYTGENVQAPEIGFGRYKDHAMNIKSIDLSLGFEYITDDRYIRFPFWILHNLPPRADLNVIKNTLSNYSILDNNFQDRRFCSLVSRCDVNGVRQQIYNSLIRIDEISCGGSFLNNTQELTSTYNDDKIAFLKEFRFNICPENSNLNGYITEKLFDAIRGGCIPIYWGSDNNPEPEVLNKDAIIFWKKDGDNTNSLRLIEDLHRNPKLITEFANQERFMPHAAEYIWDIYISLRNKLVELLKEN